MWLLGYCFSIALSCKLHEGRTMSFVLFYSAFYTQRLAQHEHRWMFNAMYYMTVGMN